MHIRTQQLEDLVAEISAHMDTHISEVKNSCEQRILDLQ